MNVLVTGAAGQLGGVIVALFRAAGHDVTATDSDTLDLTRQDDVTAYVASLAPDVMINCAAYNDVEGAESDYQAAFDVNAFALRSLARAARARGAVLVHYGTDFVFDGEASTPYRETDAVRPLSVYASSKFLGECFARDAGRHYVLRVESLFGGPAARSSIDRIAQALEAGRESSVFVDRVVSPSYVEDVARATARLLEVQAPFGVYHCVNGGYATWHEVGREIARVLGRDAALLRPVRVGDVRLKAPRPRFAALSNEKLAEAGIPMPTWQDAIRRYLGRTDPRLAGMRNV